MNLQIYTDGGARGNPGPAGIGAVVVDKDTGRVLEEVAVYLGETTNNQAEYRAAIAALQKAVDLGAKTVELISDSELMIKQARGVYKVKNADLAKRYLELKNLETQLGGRVQYRHVKREHNTRADALANQAMDVGRRA
ncbi:MAG TPA: ribonuclease HI family protein [bacterium]|nr:MAG: 14.7 kDa ribonuclease H-like protein [Parcubacteria group bacterium ADurb.Bin192]HPN15386.1 ribonuclease HI family protein [bacterium]